VGQRQESTSTCQMRRQRGRRVVEGGLGGRRGGGRTTRFRQKNARGGRLEELSGAACGGRGAAMCCVGGRPGRGSRSLARSWG